MNQTGSVVIIVLFAVLAPADVTVPLVKTEKGMPEFQHLSRKTDTATVDSSIITTGDSAFFKLPAARTLLTGTSATLEVVPHCATDSVTIFIRHSYTITDTLIRLSTPPYSTEWNFAGLPDHDQIHLQFGYLLHHSSGKTIISAPLPHQWAIDRTTRLSRKKYHCRQIVSPDSVFIDGKLDEWKRARRARINEHSTFALMWTSAFLYFAAEVRLHDINPADIIELHLDPYFTRESFASEKHRSVRFGPRSRSFCFAACPDSSTGMYRQCDSIASLLLDGISWGVTFSDSGYIIEAALPFYSLSDLDFPKLRFGLDVTTRAGTTPAHHKSWAGSGEFNRYNPSEWGTVVLHQALLPLKIALILSSIIISILLIIIIFVFIRHFYHTRRSEMKEMKGEPLMLLKIRECVGEHLADTGLNVKTTATATGLTQEQIEQVLHEELDSSFEQFLTFCRVNRAKELLWDFDMDFSEISLECGFSSPAEMEECFRRILRTDPVSFRTKIKEIAIDDEENAKPGLLADTV
jgi:AraC-like DNA-binding protein